MPLARRIKVESDAELFAISPGGSGKRDKTAIESAVNVEWEPMSELDRRIEDGVHYEHDYCKSSQKQQRKFATKEEMPVARGIFCGYRCTPEEYGRLKSADPKDREWEQVLMFDFLQKQLQMDGFSTLVTIGS
jgi:hypothetical protein